MVHDVFLNSTSFLFQFYNMGNLENFQLGSCESNFIGWMRIYEQFSSILSK